MTNKLRTWAAAIFALAGMSLVACGGDVTASPGYQQACHGEPLRDQTAIYKAQGDGYRINSRYHCIDRGSWKQVQRALARLEHERRPEMRTHREAEADREHAQRLARIAERAKAREQAAARSAVATQPLQVVDANHGSQETLAAMCGVGSDGAAAIVHARQQAGPFTDWADLVHRVVPLSAAQSAVTASRCGLTVNGRSLGGAEPASTL